MPVAPAPPLATPAPPSAPALAPVAAAPAGDPMRNKLELLANLGDLRDAGVLSDAEFEAQKAKIVA
jgi:hypothetical protein